MLVGNGKQQRSKAGTRRMLRCASPVRFACSSAKVARGLARNHDARYVAGRRVCGYRRNEDASEANGRGSRRSAERAASRRRQVRPVKTFSKQREIAVTRVRCMLYETAVVYVQAVSFQEGDRQ